ncbi:MAG: hypothetical protein HFJ43_05310 [Clostridia bacterium]|nr:hypothetical protein [Clostridia bacterium]
MSDVQNSKNKSNSSNIEYINLTKDIDDVLYITNVEKMEYDNKYRLKGVKYIPYQISEEEFLKIEESKKYTLYGTEYSYIYNKEDDEKILKDNNTGKEFYIEPYKIKSYTLYSKNEYNQLLKPTSKYLYVDVGSEIMIKDGEENEIMSVKEYFSNYEVIPVKDNSNPDSKNTFYFEFDDETGSSNCTGIIRVETILD